MNNKLSMESRRKAMNWEKLKAEETFKMSMVEFKAATLQALQDIRSDIQEIKTDRNVRTWISYGVSGIVGVIAGIFGSHVIK